MSSSEQVKQALADPTLNTYWVSWCDTAAGAYELWWPWWVSGYRMDDAATVVAAVRAADEDAARDVVLAAYDERPDDVEWRFVDEVTDPAWSPYASDRWRTADWMPEWPVTQAGVR